MARKELRNAKVILQDGLSGTGAVNDVAGVAIGASSCTCDTLVLNSTVTDQIPVGARLTFAGESTIYTVTARTPASGTTTSFDFTPVKVTPAAADDEVITFLPQRLEIKVGEGDINWTEAQGFIYDLDRGQLDTVRKDDDVPVAVDLSFTFEEVTAESGNPPTPVDALNQDGEASEWVSASSDLCEPYAVDILVIDCVPCGTDQDEEMLFPDFRHESLEYSYADASIALSGQCNVTRITATRSSSNAEC